MWVELLTDIFTNMGGSIFEYWHARSLGELAVSGIGIFGASYGVFKKWQTAERRINSRLEEHLKNEELRLIGVRNSLADKIQRYNPALEGHYLSSEVPVTPKKSTIFTSAELNIALRSLKWGNTNKAKKQLDTALDKISHRVKISETKRDLHSRQKATTHLLRGAIAASEGDHPGAYTEFENALIINPNDMEALEYAALQLVKIGNKDEAINKLTHLKDLATQANNLVLLGRTYRHLAYAYEAAPSPQKFYAKDALFNAINVLPTSEAFERAITYELLGDIQTRIGQGQYTVAIASYTHALTAYQGLGNEEGKKGVARMTVAIANCNRKIQDGGNGNTTAQLPNESVDPIVLELRPPVADEIPTIS